MTGILVAGVDIQLDVQRMRDLAAAVEGLSEAGAAAAAELKRLADAFGHVEAIVRALDAEGIGMQVSVPRKPDCQCAECVKRRAIETAIKPRAH